MMMFGFKLDEMKQTFFDREAVVRAMSRATYASLSKAGAFVRRTAMQSIRKRKGISRPGSPPSGHGDEPLKKSIFFGFDVGRQSVVVGPIRLNGRFGGNAPAVLESGGMTSIFCRSGRRGQRRQRSVQVRARPFMGPALAENLPVLGSVFTDSMKQ
jgi:hypothetical protein